MWRDFNFFFIYYLKMFYVVEERKAMVSNIDSVMHTVSSFCWLWHTHCVGILKRCNWNPMTLVFFVPLQERSWFSKQKYSSYFCPWFIWKVLAFFKNVLQVIVIGVHFMLKKEYNMKIVGCILYLLTYDWHHVVAPLWINCFSFYIIGIYQQLL